MKGAELRTPARAHGQAGDQGARLSGLATGRQTQAGQRVRLQTNRKLARIEFNRTVY